MKKKLNSKRGETLIECMAALVVVILVMAMLPMAIETAAKINASVKSMETICQRSMAEKTKTAVTAELYQYQHETPLEVLDVQGYTENGFTYYVKVGQ